MVGGERGSTAAEEMGGGRREERRKKEGIGKAAEESAHRVVNRWA
jgi:hypothetical protein